MSAKLDDDGLKVPHQTELHAIGTHNGIEGKHSTLDRRAWDSADYHCTA